MKLVPLFEEFMSEAEKEKVSKLDKFKSTLEPTELPVATPKVDPKTINPKVKGNLDKAIKEWEILQTKAEKEVEKYEKLVKDINLKSDKVKADIEKMMTKIKLGEYELENVIVKFSDESQRRSTSYESIVSVIYEKSNPILEKFIEKTFKENSKMIAVKSKLELKKKKGVTKLKENNETEITEGILTNLWNKVTTFISNSVNSLLGYADEYENALKEIDGLTKEA